MTFGCGHGTDPLGPRRRRDDRGSAVVEFVTLGVVLLVPLVYLVISVSRVQAGAFAVDGGARAAARAFASAPDEQTGRARALATVRLALRDQGFDRSPEQITELACSEAPCLTPGGQITVRIALDVELPGLPGRAGRYAHTTVRSEQIAVVDRFRAPEPTR